MKGLYFLANDMLIELVIAFLNSVRAFEPNLPICFIPYNDDCSSVKCLAEHYGFSVWSDQLSLARCDAISLHFHDSVVGQYRKLAVWDGPFDDFAYIDVDTIFLSGIDFVFQLLRSYDVITGTSNLPSIRKFVWKGDVESVNASLDTSYSANTGFIVSCKGALSLSLMENKLGEAKLLKDFMELNCTEQPLLNYLIVTSGVRYSSISLLNRTDENLHLPKEIWSGSFKEDILRYDQIPLFIHWAGVWRKGDHRKSATWRHFRDLRADSK